ncbi:MAG: leucine-rich repeat protein, partial [Christensenellales bacterium]
MEANQVETKPTVCPKCGKSVQSDFTRCPYCGAKLRASSNNVQDFKEKAKSFLQSIVRVAKAHKKATIGIVVALVVVIALIPIISAITSPFNSLKANSVSVGYQTAEEVEKQFGKPTDVLTDTYSSLPASCDEVWVYYPDSIDNQIKSINKMLENANSFADLDKADKEYQKLTEKKFKQVVIGISDDKVVFYSLNTQAMYNEEDLFATKDSKELSKCTFNKTMVCRDTTVSDNKITFTAKFTDGSIFIGKVSGYSRVDEKNPTVEFSCPWSKLSLTLNVVDHYFSNSCTCKNCGNEVHDLDNDCKCSRCNNSFHNIHGCECVNCDYNTHTPDADCVCTICHQSAHIINKINCTCLQCGESFHKLDEYYTCIRCNNYGLKYEIIDDNNCTITDCVGLSGSIAIPDSYQGIPVTTIGSEAFKYCSSLTSITIPASVTKIEYGAFKGCNQLTDLTIPFIGMNDNTDQNEHFGYIFGTYSYQSNESYVPSSLKRVTVTVGTRIGYSAFRDCSSLTSITIPDSVTSIGDYAFSYCSSLTSITIPDSVTSVGGGAFSGCSSLTSITIPDSVTSVGGGAFSGCSSLTSITIPDSVTSIGYGALSDCSSLRSITLPFIGTTQGIMHHSTFYGVFGDGRVPSSLTSVNINGGTRISSREFEYNSSLTSITISDSVTSIGEEAFYNCSGLTSITIPDSVTSIGDNAFYNCNSLTSVSIGNGVSSIGNSAFERCSSLTSITIPDSVTSIGESAFSDTAWYDNQPDGMVYAGKVACIYKGTMPSDTSIVIKDGTLGIAGSAFRYCSNLTSITIPDSVTSIGDYAFSSCDSLTSITIPNSVTSIGYLAFYNCSNLTSIFVQLGNTKYHSDGNCIIETENKTLIAGFSTSVIPTDGSVTSIGDWAFYNCSSLTS